MRPLLDALPNFSKWAKQVVIQESVTYTWDEEENMKITKERLQKMRGAAK